jgi:hypothetical protein
MEMNILHQNYYMQWDTLAINEISHSLSNFEPCTMYYKYGRCKHSLYDVDILDSKITDSKTCYFISTNIYCCIGPASIYLPFLHRDNTSFPHTYHSYGMKERCETQRCSGCVNLVMKERCQTERCHGCVSHG